MEENSSNNAAGNNNNERPRFNRENREGRGSYSDRPKLAAMEVPVDHGVNIEKAIKVLKRKLIKEGLFRELKQRRYYEKPSQRRKRKTKESIKKARKDEARNRKNPFMLA